MNDLPSLGWLDGLQEAVWVLDEASQHILQANACAERLTGLSAAAMRGRSVLDLASTPQELAFWSEPVDVIAQGVTAHTSLLRADGSLVPVQRCVRRVPWGEGGGTALLLTMLDRSLQETTERELETLLSELRATLDSATDGMLVCGLDRRVRAFNQRLAQLWSLPRQLLVERDDAAVYAFMADQVSDPRFYAERLVGPSAGALEGCMAASLCGGGSDAAFMEQVLQGWASEGFWEGELWLPRDNGAYCAVQLSWVALRDDEGRLVQSIGFMRDLTLQHAAQKRIEELAYSDALTGLPNRLLLSQRVDTAIQGARQSDTGFAILFLDMDRFKIINDSLGHPFGDRVLQLVAERLQTCLRQTDMLCRLGGDEFVIYLHGGDASVAESVARRILDDMLKPFTLDSMGFSIQCSIGIALYPQDGATLDDLIKQSDTAMYRVKERGRGSYGFYQPQMNANLLARMQMEHAMRQALGLQRMAVHYQPQVNMATGRITGAEALLRWTDPEFGAVSPGVFIPLAEESGYIVTLGAWVMEQAVREAALWMHSGSPIMISVNVSALEFRQPDFVDRITRLLAVHQLPPTLLELELTETILLQDAQEMEQRLRVLADLGIGLAIDDFGTGYSSLAYLKKLPIHKLKIDQSFVRGLPDDDGDRAIVSAIISMGRAMHIEVVAEGVETETQQAVLQQMQCEHYQGFLCAPGLPTDQFRALLSKPLPLKAQGRHRPLNT